MLLRRWLAMLVPLSLGTLHGCELDPAAGVGQEEMVLEVLLCTQSNVRGNAGLSDGHAWISYVEVVDTGVARVARVTTYGSWPDGHPLVNALGLGDGGSDVRRNLEGAYAADHAAFCVSLTAQQQAGWAAIRDRAFSWGYFNNCAAYAEERFNEATGENVDASDGIGALETPRRLGDSILAKNGNNADGLLAEVRRRAAAMNIASLETTGGIFDNGDGTARAVNTGNQRCDCSRTIANVLEDDGRAISPHHWTNEADQCSPEAFSLEAYACGCHDESLTTPEIGCDQVCPCGAPVVPPE